MTEPTNETSTQSGQGQPSPQAAPRISKHRTLSSRVAEAIAKSGSHIEDRIVENLTEKEVERRTQACLKAIAEIDSLDREFAKMKPDHTVYAEDGKQIVQQGFSKALIETREKNRAKVSKLQKALDKALESNDFGDLFNASKNGGDNSGEDKS